MNTKFKLLFEGKPDIEINKFKKSLPGNFIVSERNDGIYVEIESDYVEDERCQYLIDRELDRHFFLTSVKISAEMVRTRVSSDFSINYRIHGSLPDNIRPQNWNYELPIQLRLWSLASDTKDLRIKIILLFQIIEISKVNFPKYTDPTSAPHPLLECKFVRDLVSHSGDVSNNQLKLYCSFLNLPEVMLDITDSNHQKIIFNKVNLLIDEAKKIIEKTF